jgi:hypothetical protein
MSKGITSTEGLIRKVFSITCAANEVLFYRGHSNKDKYKLEPSLYRSDSLLKSENLMFNELIAANPSDFSDDSSTFEKLVRMQHYSLPTRLLDITSNPLMALYFACKSNLDKIGEVIVFKIMDSYIKFFDSDTASCLSNLARLPQSDKDAIDLTLDIVSFNESPPIARLLHFIKEEKPFFLNKIVPDDLGKVICVKSKMSNSRIISQSGSFLVFGLKATLQHPNGITIEQIHIKPSEKQKILKELDSLNINEQTVFPYIESSAKYISKKYGG